MSDHSLVIIHCPICDRKFGYDDNCPECGRDREGFTDEERMKIRPKSEIINSHLLDMKRMFEKRKRKKERKKFDHNPFPGRTSKIRVVG